MTNQTSPFVGGNQPRPGFWSRLTPVQRVGMILAILVLPCCGGAALVGAVFGDDKPKNTIAEPLAADRSTAPATTEQAGDQPAAATTGPETEQTSAPAGTTPTSAPAGTTPTSAPAGTTPTSAPARPVVTTKKVTRTTKIAFPTRMVKDSSLAKGTTEVRTKGVAGVRTITYQVTMTDGRETARKQISSVVTRKPVTKVVAVGTKTSSCDPNYSGACVPIASDVDCAGGSGNGPAYVQGPVRVVGSDVYDLDRDGDGIACDS